MKEKDITTIFGKENIINGVFEIKLCKGKSIRFDSVADHQIEALNKVSTDGLFHKISDSLPVFGGNKHMRFTHKKPFDCFFLSSFPAYIVICFYEPRRKKNFYYIDPRQWVEAEYKSDKKSIKEEQCEELSTYTLKI